MINKLFTSGTRVKVLSYLYFECERAGIRKIARGIGVPVSGVKREVDNLRRVGVLELNDGLIKINWECSFSEDLRNVLVKSDYLYFPIRDALKGNIDFALIFGSFARGVAGVDSDVDLLVLGDVKSSEIFRLMRPIEKRIGREINPVVWRVSDFVGKRKGAFVRDVMKNKKIMLIGGADELRKVAGK